MKPTGLWLKHLAMAGLCLIWAGCGGSDVPDPSSDSLAASEPTAPVARTAKSPVEATPEPTPAPSPSSPEIVATPAPTPAPAASPPAEAEPAKVASTTSEPTPAPESATPPATDTAKGNTSGTDEMLRMAATPTAPGGDAASPPPTSTPVQTPAAAPAAIPAAPQIAPIAATGLAPIGGGEVAAPTPPGGQTGRNRNSELAAPGGDQTARRSGDEMQAPTGVGGGPGGPGGRGGDGGMATSGGFGGGGGPGRDDSDPGPGAFRNPGSAVQAFLSALKAKNKDRLSQATARRAATEAVEKHRKIFAAILEQSISDEELDDMAKMLEGYQIASVLPAKSTGSNGVVITKMDNRDRLQRTVMVRKEKEGWKVMDFIGFIDQKPVGTYRRPGSRR